MSVPARLKILQSEHPELQIDWVEVLESTQCLVKPQSLLIAEQQSAGVGRRGNHWLSAKGKSICLSYRYNLQTDLKQMSGYALMVAVTIIETMAEFEQPVMAQVKWPNDLLHHHKKFAGVLINIKPGPNNLLDVTTGIGINWSLNQQEIQSVDQPVCNIPIVNKPQRSRFISMLIKRIKLNNQRYLMDGLKSFIDHWKNHDYLTGKTIRIHQPSGESDGQYVGIDENGQLLVSIKGIIKHISGGEVSVRTI